MKNKDIGIGFHWSVLLALKALLAIRHISKLKLGLLSIFFIGYVCCFIHIKEIA